MSNVRAAQIRHLRSGEGGLRLRLLGPLALENEGQPVPLPSKKARALLGYLALREGTAVPRSVITGLLWGERSEAQARGSLRQALSELRAALAGSRPHPLAASKETITWTPGAGWIDARIVEAAADSEDDELLRGAAGFAGGELMEGLSIGEAPFEQWLVTERERFRLLAGKLRLRLMEAAERDGKLEEALSHGQALLSLDPLQEHVHRALMRLYALQSRHDAALAQYEKCRRALNDQLGVQPEPETQALARSVRTGRREPVATQPAPVAALALPDKTSIAVLAFANLAGERDHAVFADGMTEDLIAALSRIAEFFVISRSSSFAYRGRSVRAEDVARELGVRFVLEGSIRIAGDRVRVTAQLVDGTTGGQVWAERYEAKLGDIFSVQDEITRSIVLALQVKLTYGETVRLWEGGTRDLRAWEKMVEGRALFSRFTRADNARARELLEEAVAIDPNYSGAIANLGMTYWVDARFNRATDREESLRNAERQAQRLLELDPELALGHSPRAGIAFLRDRHDEAVAICEKAVLRAPSDSTVLAFYGVILQFSGEAERGVAALKAAMRLSPFHPSWYVYNLAMACLWTGELSTAQQLAEDYRRREPNEPFGYTLLAQALAFQGRQDDAAAAIAELKERFPEIGIGDIELSQRYKEPEKLKRVVAALRAAGLPD